MLGSSAQTKLPNKWVLLLLAAAVITGAFVMKYTVPQAPLTQMPTLSTATVRGQVVWLASPALRSIFDPRSSRSAMEDIERAERLNLYQMQQYQRRVLRDIQSQPSSVPITITSSVLEDVLVNHR
jgi:hypothetical protein